MNFTFNVCSYFFKRADNDNNLENNVRMNGDETRVVLCLQFQVFTNVFLLHWN